MADLDSGTASRPRGQFKIATLMQIVTLVAVWCSAAMLDESLTHGIILVFVIVPITWAIVGKWSLALAPNWGRRLMAVLATGLVAAGLGITALVGDLDYIPVASFLVVFLGVLWPWQISPLLGIAVNAFVFYLGYTFWIWVFRSWDWLANFSYTSGRRNQSSVATFASFLVGFSALPAIAVVALGRCYQFQGHLDRPSGTSHLPIHCAVHVAMIVIAAMVLVVLNRACLSSCEVPKPWVKLMVWGYVCLYSVLLMVALFPVEAGFP